MSTMVEIPVRLYLFQLSTLSLPTANGPLELSEGCYLVQTSTGRNLLIDSGSPGENVNNVLAQLAALGLQPSDIQTVICTHFDIDHVGYHPSFPDAEFVVQREQYDSAFGGYPRYAESRPYWDQPGRHYRLVEGDVDLFPGFRLLHTPGHAPGHQSVLLRLPKTGVVLLAIDAVVMGRLFTPDRVAWPTDDDQDVLRASTRKLQAIVEQEQAALVIFGHDGQQWWTLRKSPNFYD
ncbi:MAG: N-acyl homoserine lactonase family protein [Anaerolineae bacterium]